MPCNSDADNSWVLISSVLVLGMCPALAFFESGLLRCDAQRKIAHCGAAINHNRHGMCTWCLRTQWLPPCRSQSADTSRILILFSPPTTHSGVNTVSILSQVFGGISILSLMWFVFGYSAVYADSLGGVIGRPDQHALFRHVSRNDCLPGYHIPEMTFAMFQVVVAWRLRSLNPSALSRLAR